MEPPWIVEPDYFADEHWILGKSAYLKKWREWFVALPEDEKSAYEAMHPLSGGHALFYLVFGAPPYDPARVVKKFRDAEGLLAPPWIARPDIPFGSIGWRMGSGEDYWFEFDGWYRALSPGQKSEFKAKYPEPSEVEQGLPWTGFYDRKERQ